MKPSWAVTKLTLAQGLRPRWLNSRRGAEPRRQSARRCLAAPEIAHGVAEFVVPLGPARREPADLVAAGAAIPGLGDQLHRGEHRILTAGLQKAALVVEAIRLAREDRAEIEAEAVDMGLVHPIAQAVGDHLDDADVIRLTVLPVPVSLM